MSFIQANDIYALINVQGGTCIDLSQGDNATVTGYEYHNGDNQKWIFQNAGDNIYYLRSKGIKRFLSSIVDRPSGTEKIIGSGLEYRWEVEDEPGVDGGVRLSPSNNRNLCIDLSDHGNPAPGTPVQLWGRWEGKNQVWKLQKVE